MTGRTGAARTLAIALATSVAVTSCAHVGEGTEAPALTERVIREVCIPYVVDGIEAAEVGRRLGGWWTRELPDPFSPQPGPTFHRGRATVQVISGRSLRTPDGALTTRPMRNCHLWIGRENEAVLVTAVRAAAASRPDAVMAAPGQADGFIRVIACVPSEPDRTAVVRAYVYPTATARSGAGVYQTGGAPDPCVG
ncbi:MAG: hypothetical protein ACXW3K_03805 [Brevundimonas sp.]